MNKLFVLFLGLLFTSQIFAIEIESSELEIKPARIVELVKLVDKSDIKVNVLVHDLGGSTDFSPTQEVYLTLYVKGEMFNTDATFNLGQIYEFISAKRVAGGIYEVKVVAPNKDTYAPEEKIFVVNAVDAILSIKAVDCNGDFDCDASTQFKAKIDLTIK